VCVFVCVCVCACVCEFCSCVALVSTGGALYVRGTCGVAEARDSVAVAGPRGARFVVRGGFCGETAEEVTRRGARSAAS